MEIQTLATFGSPSSSIPAIFSMFSMFKGVLLLYQQFQLGEPVKNVFVMDEFPGMVSKSTFVCVFYFLFEKNKCFTFLCPKFNQVKSIAIAHTNNAPLLANFEILVLSCAKNVTYLFKKLILC